ncbi:metal resistance protein YCF1 [Amanita muscaria]
MASCRDPEGWGPVSPSRAFDVTPCFEEGVVLSPLLAGFTCLALLNTIVLYNKEPTKLSKKNWILLWAKISLLVIAFAVSLAGAVFAFQGLETVTGFLPHFLEPASIFAGMLFTYFHHTRFRASATLSLLFWPIYILALMPWVRTTYIVNAHRYTVMMLFKCIVVLLGIAFFILENFTNYDVNASDLNKEGENPILRANIFSLWSFSWLSPLLRKGATTVIGEDDLPPLRPSHKSGYLGHYLEEALKKHKLWKALFVAYGKPYAVALILKFTQDSLAFLQPQLLRWLLAYISRYQEARLTSYSGVDRPTSLEGFVIAFVMFSFSVVQSITLNQYFKLVFETGMRVRAGLVVAIYNKALIISNDERGKRATGDIVNLMSVDANRLQEFCTYGLILLSGPFQITIAFISLYNLLGWAAFVGVAVMIISVPLNTYIASLMNKMQEEQMKNRDRRTRLMSELLNNIKSIKLYAWENTFMRRILDTRNNRELKMLKQLGVLSSCIMTLWTGIPLLVAFVSFATVAITSTHPLTADRIFPAISLFMLLQFPLGMLGQVTSAAVETLVSVRRLADFLNAQELQHDARELIMRSDLKFGVEVLNVNNADFAWSSTAINPTLEGITLSVRMGEVVGIFGRVGAGKSSLLSAIIGDLVRTEGQIELYGSVAYVPQSPWIMTASVRENILFSHEYDEAFYNAVIEACALTQDLALLPQGDHTEVGEKGITLSGGQRARVALARAVYSRSDLILLDDCLSAVDSHVARHVFDNVIGPKGLLASKARILVTNTVSFAKQFDRLVYFRRGIVLESGTYDALCSETSSEMYKLLQGHGSSSGTSTPFLLDGTTTPVTISEKISQEIDYGKAKLANAEPVHSRAVGLSKEHVEQGQVKGKVYKQYINAASRVGFFIFLLTTMATQVAALFASLTLRYWGEHNREAGDNSGMLRYLIAYGSFSLLSTTLGGVSAVIMWVFCGLRSAKLLHDSMLSALLCAPLTFFELTPTGRILNLFSRDIYIIDQILPRIIQQLCRNLAVCMSIMVVISWSFPLFILFVIPLGWFYWSVMRYYLATSRELKRLDAVSRSPIFAWFSESLAGVSSIRAFNQQSVFMTNNQLRLDRNQICYLPSIYVNRWLAVRLEFVGATMLFVVATLAIVALRTTGVDAGLVGLVISYALNTTASLNWVVRIASEVEQNVVSVERILHQTEVNPEAPHEIMENKPDEDWPSQGEIEFRNYSARYRPELGLVLRDLSIKIRPSEKIGICGRTGAGKSSMLLALFRIIEPATGTIIIDGVDITKIGLHDLRSAISIVPQTQDLFEGTLRENIDPVGEHTDMDIWTALGQVHLKEFVENLPGALDAAIQEGGAPLSAGQKQLLCFSRALLRKSKLLVLDEATSAVDLDTDRTVQDIIRGPAFLNVTILTIAHRLNTIMESSRVLVMDAGKIIEFDSPNQLLSDTTTVFYSLAKEADLV